jgi:VWFA-related protein
MFRHRLLLTFGSLIVLGWLGLAAVRTPVAPGKEKNPSPQADSVAKGVIKSEANMVLVNVIVTDKQGNYLRDMKQKEFHVFEDGKEQLITSFSREADSRMGAPGRQGGGLEYVADIKPLAPVRPRYMVIYFDDDSLSPEGQLYERDQAVKFVESTASPNRMVAVIDHAGTLKLTQDFTANQDLLKNAVKMAKFSPLNPETVRSITTIAELDARTRLWGLRDVARMLGRIPGRKTMLFLSAGIPANPLYQSYFDDAIDALNKANVGVYTIGAHGLQGLRMASAATGSATGHGGDGAPGIPRGLLQLAQQTGGFAFFNNNDLQGGMEKASAEMDEYYLLGYVPPNPVHDGRYHKIHVKVDRAGADVRYRNGYSDTKSANLLVAKSEGHVLEARAASFDVGEIPVNLTTPYFYVKPGVARINLTLSIPVSSIDFKKHGDDFHSQVNVLGIATRDDGSVAARFSDTASVDYKKDEKPAKESPFYYENSFKIAPGEYTFKLVLSAGGEKFGKYVVPLVVEPFTDQEFTLSGPAFGDAVVTYLLDSAEMDPALIEGSVPMVANGMQIVPSSSNRFKKDKQPVVYMEVYDPLLASENLSLGFLYDIVNRKTQEKVQTSNTLPINQYVRPGNPRVPVIFNLLIDKLQPGDYAIEIRARDSAGNISPVRTGEFSVQ